MLKKQTYRPSALTPHDLSLMSTLGLDYPEGRFERHGKNWIRYQVCHAETFSLVSLQRSPCDVDNVSHTKQEEYVKVTFWLGGKHTTVLDGFGQCDHERPEVFITAGPSDMLKVDVLDEDCHVAAVAVCLLRDFFPMHLGLPLEDLPEPLRSIMLPYPEHRPVALLSFSLTPDLVMATRAILAAPCAVRQDPVYAQAKAVELMCLLINRITFDRQMPRAGSKARSRQESRLQDARHLLSRHYAEPITLERICKDVGLNKRALTSGFRQLFGMSVYDCLQKERMERAYDLLQDEDNTIGRVAEAVGFTHPCNFSTAFRARYGCTPQEARASGPLKNTLYAQKSRLQTR